MYSFFTENNLSSLNQSGFRQGDFCINQLISVTHETYQSMYQGYEVRGVFLDISKAFNIVWHKGLLHKLKGNGINGPLLNVLGDFHLGVMLLQSSPRIYSWNTSFLDLYKWSSDGLHSNPKLFSYDTFLFSTVHDITGTTNEPNNALRKKTYGCISGKYRLILIFLNKLIKKCFQEKTLKYLILL